MITKAQDVRNKIAALAIPRDGRPNSYKTIDNLRIQKLAFRSELKGQRISPARVQNDLKFAAPG